MFPMGEEFTKNILENPSEIRDIPMKNVWARWQWPIQVLAENRDPERLKKRKRKNSPSEDWPMPPIKKPKIGEQCQNLISRLIMAQNEEKFSEKIQRIIEILEN